MPLSSTSTDAEVTAAWDDNADFDLQATPAAAVAKAREFIHAGRIMLRRLADSGSDRISSFRQERKIIQDEVDRATEYCRGLSADLDAGFCAVDLGCSR